MENKIDNTRVAVIVLNYNSSTDCKKCIGYLLNQEGVEIDIVVVDNCSLEEDRIRLSQIIVGYTDSEKGNHQITYILNDENKGYNAGNNIGLRYSYDKGYKYAMIANPDMEFPDVHYVSSIVKGMEQDFSIVVYATDIVNNDDLHQNPMRETLFWEEFLWPVQWIMNRGKSAWYTLDYKKCQICEKVAGCCLMVSLDFMHEIDFFDENVFLYSEEAILGKQVILSGKQMFYDSKLFAIHRHIESAKGNKNKRMQILFDSRSYYLSNYSGYNKVQLFFLSISRFLQRKIWGF